MRSLIILLLSVFVLISCATEKLGKNYGPIDVVVAEAVNASEVRNLNQESGNEIQVTFEGTITEVCSKAGCWVNIDDGNGSTFMVRFKDHFTIPTNTKPGTVAYFHGVAFNDTVSVELLQHFAEDAGKSQEEIDAITEPKIEMGFTADGIVIKK